MVVNVEDLEFWIFLYFLDSLFWSFKLDGICNLIIDICNNLGGNDLIYEKVFIYLIDYFFWENKEVYIIFNKLFYLQYF